MNNEFESSMIANSTTFLYTTSIHMQTTHYKYTGDSVVHVRTHLLTSDFGSSTRGDSSYYANHTIWPHKHAILYAPMAKIQLSASMVQCQPSTDVLLKFSNSRPISSGHDVIHTPTSFPVWALLWQLWLSYPLRASVKCTQCYPPEVLTRIVQSTTKLNDKI